MMSDVYSEEEEEEEEEEGCFISNGFLILRKNFNFEMLNLEYLPVFSKRSNYLDRSVEKNTQITDCRGIILRSGRP